jgi:tRNA-specific 2-thiouridylase
VLAALSGGVDSAVAAARARDAGHDVTAVHLGLSDAPGAERSGSRGCCTLEDARDARRVADVLEVPFYVWDLAGPFRERVIDDFVASYAAGRTPNPCLRCNERIKFAAVLDKATALGFDALVTGHHARLVGGVLRRSVDPGKDQSYVLGLLTAAQLARSMFPLGESTKAQVRAEAAHRGLAVADKPDSHDVCFIPDGDTAAFLRGRLGPAPGPVVDTDGVAVGAHQGAFAFTVGQRHGLGLDRPGPDGAPRYVLSVSVVDRTVTVGSAADLEVTRIIGGTPVWSAGVGGGGGGRRAGGAGATAGPVASARRARSRARRARSSGRAGDHPGEPGARRGPRPGCGALRRRCGARRGIYRAHGTVGLTIMVPRDDARVPPRHRSAS